jgi:Zn-dependent M28 family amino/carboxypeptidase
VLLSVCPRSTIIAAVLFVLPAAAFSIGGSGEASAHGARSGGVIGEPGSSAGASGDLDRIAAQLLGEEMVSGGAYAKLAWLTDRIGPRLSGSVGAEAAVTWALDEFRKDGMARVRAEKVMVPHWVRGEERAEIVSPVAQRLVATALGMSVPTPLEGITARVLEVSSFDELHALGDSVRGAIVLFNKKTLADRHGEGYRETSPLRYRGPSEAARQGAVAVLVRSLGTLAARLPHTGALGYLDDAPKIPAAAVTEEDADLIHRLLAAGETVRVSLVLGCRTLPDAESANVVAELRGRSLPDEIVVIGGHLDSWDLGTGAIDDGAGVAMSMEALRLLKSLKLRPRRTIRAVLFMNEENGVHGGQGYADAHEAELQRHVAAIESDSGAGRPIGFSLNAGEGAAESVRALARSLRSIGADDVEAHGEGGTDIGPLLKSGCPLLGLRQDMTHYFDWHHTAGDTLDKVDPRELAENTAAMAFMAYALADRAEPLPRVPPEARQPARH